MAAVLQGGHRGAAQRPDLGRHRLGQDDDAQRALVRTSTSDERIVTIEDSAELQLQQHARRPARDAPAEHRRARRGHPARPRQERAADAAGPHHPGRVPRGRGVRHAPGDEHRPRRLDDHDPRQHAARCAVADRADDRHERDRHLPPGRRARRSPRPSMSCCRSAGSATGGARCMSHVRSDRHGGRGRHHAGDLPLRAGPDATSMARSPAISRRPGSGPSS